MRTLPCRLVVALVLVTLAACKSDFEKRRAAWERHFGAIAERYSAMAQGGGPEISVAKVKGRRALISPPVTFGKPGEGEARTTDDVAIVVTWSVKDDATPSRVYENGIKGYGGQVQVTAWAYPEAKWLAAESWHCRPPTAVFRDKNFRTGHVDDRAEHCGPSVEVLSRFASDLANGRAPEGSNATDDARKAFDAIAARYVKQLDACAVSPIDVRGKKLLLYALDDDRAPQLYCNEYLLPSSTYADDAGSVGVFGLVRTTHEATPSEHYSNDAVGYAGEAELLLFAHPSGELLSRVALSCALPSDDLVTHVMKSKNAERCAGDVAGIRAALAEKLGPMAAIVSH